MLQVTETCLPAGQPRGAGFRNGAEQKGQVVSVNHRARVCDRAWRTKNKEEDRKAGRG